MENQIVTIEKMPFNDVSAMAKIYAESGMFADTKSQAQAFVKIMAGQEIGIPPFAAMSGIHIIQGKPTIGAGLIASRVKGSGKYDYKIKEQSEKQCSIDFYQGKEIIGNSTFTLEDAKKAGTKNLDKFPKNMLFARAISNGVKWFCPDVFSGPVYTPEEMESVIDIPHEVIPTPFKAEVNETPQPEITNYVHAINAIKKHPTAIELKHVWNRCDLPTQSHPAVIDEMVATFYTWIDGCQDKANLDACWSNIGTIGKDKEFQKNVHVKAKAGEKKESFKQPA